MEPFHYLNRWSRRAGNPNCSRCPCFTLFTRFTLNEKHEIFNDIFLIKTVTKKQTSLWRQIKKVRGPYLPSVLVFLANLLNLGHLYHPKIYNKRLKEKNSTYLAPWCGCKMMTESPFSTRLQRHTRRINKKWHSFTAI